MIVRRRVLVAASAAGLGLGAGLLPFARGRSPEPPEDVCRNAPPLPYDPASGLAPLAARPVPVQARCPVCGMYPARYPGWAALAVFDDGAAQFLDSPLHLLLYLQRVPRYSPGRESAGVRALYLRDLRTQTWVRAEQAFLVHGSAQAGPMRSPDLPAFASEADARALAKRDGAVVRRFDALRAELPAELLALAPHRH